MKILRTLFILSIVSAMIDPDLLAKKDKSATKTNHADLSNTADGISSANPTIHNTPLNDLGADLYLGRFQGGLYPDGNNIMPEEHARVGMERGRAVQPLDINGKLSPSGKCVLLGLGFSNPSQEFGHTNEQNIPNEPASFTGQAAADGGVNHTWVVLVKCFFPAGSTEVTKNSKTRPS